MHEQIIAEREANQSRWIDCFATPSARRRMWIGIFVNIFNNLGGTPVISNYQSKLFKEIGFTGTKTLFLSGCYGLAGFAGVLTNITLVADRMGRKDSMCKLSYQTQCLISDNIRDRSYCPRGRSGDLNAPHKNIHRLRESSR
jgi:hypothetical protein